MTILFNYRLLNLALIVFFGAAFVQAQTNPQIQTSTINIIAAATESNKVATGVLQVEDKAAINAVPSALENEQNDQTKTPTPFTYERPVAKERFKKYLDRAAGPFTLIGVAAGSVFAHISDQPEDWENNFKGYARRFGSAFGENAIEQTVVYGLDETFKVDSLFYKKGRGTKTGARIANALLTTVTARTPSGRRVPGFSRIAGAYTANVISTTTWYPDRFSYQDGLRQGTISLGFNAGFNLLREFVFPGKRK